MSEEHVEHNQRYADQRYVDPTPPTEARILAQVNSASAIFDEKIRAIYTKITAMDRAQTLFHEDLVRVPTDVDKSVVALKELHQTLFNERFNAIASTFNERFQTMSEKFSSIDTQFKERDERVKQTALDTKTAVDAALAAQEKGGQKQNESNAAAAAKTEENFSKQIETQRQLLDARTGALSDKIDSLKDLVIRGEGRDTGKSTSLGIVFAIVGAAIGIGGFVLAVMKMN